MPNLRDRQLFAQPHEGMRPGRALTPIWGIALLLLALSLAAPSSIADQSPNTSAFQTVATSECSAILEHPALITQPDRFRCLTAHDQAIALQADIEGRALLPLSDGQILSLMAAMKPDAFVEYARSGMIQNNTYEYRMRRQERVSGHWPERADHIDIRYEDTPRKVYARWLPDGQHAGQEILYDETRAADTLLGHPGGPLRIISAEIPIDSIFARAQSRHSVRDFGLQFVTRTIEHDARSFREEGLSEKPAHVEIITMNSIRLLAWTWSAPSGPPNHYAKNVQLLFDLVHPWPSDEIAWDGRGELLERIHFEDIEPRRWDAASFSRHNPDFGFD